MPDEHESCNKYDRLSHTSALGELFIADESKKAQEEIQKSCVFRNDNQIDAYGRRGVIGNADGLSSARCAHILLAEVQHSST